jgi:hypothetical protein
MSTTFEQSFVNTIKELNGAKAYYQKMKRNSPLDMRVISPQSLSKSFFNQRLKPGTRQYIQMIYDASVTNRRGLVGVMGSLSSLQTCLVYRETDHTPEKVYICDMKSTKTMTLPATTADFVKLHDCVCSLIMDSEQLSVHFINHHKSIRVKTHQCSEGFLGNLRKNVTNGNEQAIGGFAAVLVWMLETKYMNKNISVHNSCAISSDYNHETMLFKSNPIPPPPQVTEVNPVRVEEEPVKEEAAEPLCAQQNEEDIPDSWEDL